MALDAMQVPTTATIAITPESRSNNAGLADVLLILWIPEFRYVGGRRKVHSLKPEFTFCLSAANQYTPFASARDLFCIVSKAKDPVAPLGLCRDQKAMIYPISKHSLLKPKRIDRVWIGTSEARTCPDYRCYE
jgi:hypothetical protein